MINERSGLKVRIRKINEIALKISKSITNKKRNFDLFRLRTCSMYGVIVVILQYAT